MSEVNGPAITVLGVGNAVMGDDAAGLEILRLLKARVAGGSGDSPAPVDVDALVPLASASASPSVPGGLGLYDAHGNLVPSARPIRARKP